MIASIFMVLAGCADLYLAAYQQANRKPAPLHLFRISAVMHIVTVVLLFVEHAKPGVIILWLIALVLIVILYIKRKLDQKNE